MKNNNTAREMLVPARKHQGIIGYHMVTRRLGNKKVEVREPIYQEFTAPAHIAKHHTRKTIKARAKNKVARQSRKINAQRAKAKRWGKQF